MKHITLALLFTFLLMSCSNSGTDTPSKFNQSDKDENGMSLSAPQETKQYLFKLGTWELKTKYHNGSRLVDGTGTSKVYFSEDGLTYIEEMSLNFGGNISKSIATFKFNTKTQQWDNLYKDSTGETKFHGKLVNNVLTEFTNGSDSNGSYTSEYYYENIDDKKYSYREKRVYSGNFSIMTWYFDATKTE